MSFSMSIVWVGKGNLKCWTLILMREVAASLSFEASKDGLILIVRIRLESFSSSLRASFLLK